MAYRNNYRGGYGRTARRSTGGSRWMDLRYKGTCKVCKKQVPAGERAFYDAESRTVTCFELECCVADGLTEQVWSGSPVSGAFVAQRTEKRMGTPYPLPDPEADDPFAKTRSRGYYGRDARRCEDAPCCGCCD